jgi:hypothetical protein
VLFGNLLLITSSIVQSNDESKSEELVSACKAHFHEFFSLHDTLRPGFHDNFVENMATSEAANNKLFNQWEDLKAHVVTYLRGKYQLETKGS